MRGERGRPVIELYVDSEEGVTLDLCSALSRSLSEAIDVEGVVQGSYRINVSSPGIERPLRYSWQYRKHVGRTLQVRFRLGEEVLTKAYVLTAADSEGIGLETADRRESMRLGFDQVLEATVKAPW